MTVLADPRLGRTARQAWLAVRLTPVQIQRPQKVKVSAQDSPARLSLYALKLYALEAKEINRPAGVEPFHWRLLTTHAGVA